MSAPYPPVEDLLHLELKLGGQRRRFRLKVPRTGRVVPLWSDTASRRQNRDGARRWLGIELRSFIESMDGEAVDLGTSRRLVADQAALAALMNARYRLLSQLVQQGVYRAWCPHCGERENPMDLGVLLYLMRSESWPLAEPETGFPNRPFLSVPPASGARPPGVDLAAGVEFTLPSAAVNLPGPKRPFDAGQLQRYCADDEARAWQAVATDPRLAGTRELHREYGNPGYRAIVRVSAALRLDRGRAPTALDIEDLPACDFHFLEALYRMAFAVDLPAETASIHCVSCSRPYLPAPA